MTVTALELALFAAAFMVAVASPGPFIAALVARSMAYGVRSGAAMAVGAVAGDFLFATLAMIGLAALSVWMDWALVILKYVGAAWLIWMGISLIRRRVGLPDPGAPPPRDNLWHAFWSAVVLGIGNPKAALFYVAVFPGFFDISDLTVWDGVAILGVIAPILIGGNLIWAMVAARAGRLLKSARAVRRMNVASGGVLGAAGVAIAAT
ncbi:MAG: LysE family translocator [Pseudomonadota bacterium]